jgi:hypothetical protein
MQPITAHADQDLFFLSVSPSGFCATIPYAPEIEPGMTFVLEAWREAPEVRGIIQKVHHDLKPDGYTSDVVVASEDLDALFVHLKQAQHAWMEMAARLLEIKDRRAAEN